MFRFVNSIEETKKINYKNKNDILKIQQIMLKLSAICTIFCAMCESYAVEKSLNKWVLKTC